MENDIKSKEKYLLTDNEVRKLKAGLKRKLK
jgi:hypothetical protein